MKFRSPEHLLIKFTWADLPSPILANLGFNKKKKKAGSLLQFLHSLIRVCKDRQKQAHTAREGKRSPRDSQGRQRDSTNSLHRCRVKRFWWHGTKPGEEKHANAPEWRKKCSLQAEQSSKTCQHAPFCVSALSVGGQANQVNRAYQHRFINVFSLLPQMLSSTQDCSHVLQEANICSAGWGWFAFRQSVLWHWYC